MGDFGVDLPSQPLSWNTKLSLSRSQE